VNKYASNQTPSPRKASRQNHATAALERVDIPPLKACAGGCAMIAIREPRRARSAKPMATPMSVDQIKRRRLARSVAARLETRRLTK
jgi:hypothetical protein